MEGKKLLLKKIFKVILVPFSFLVVYLTLIALWETFGFPPQEELIEIIKKFFTDYGLIVVFFGALVEGFLLLGQYFPGGFIIFLGVISAGSNIPKAAGIVAIVSVAFFISYYINYLVGKHGWYGLFIKFGLRDSIERSKKKLTRHALKAILGSYWEPNLASITATAAGILQIPVKKFLVHSLIGIMIWNTLWGTFVFILGDTALKFAGRKYIISIFLIWIVIVGIASLIENRREEKNNASQSKTA